MIKKGVKDDTVKDKEISSLKLELENLDKKHNDYVVESDKNLSSAILERDLSTALSEFKAVPQLQKYLVEDVSKMTSIKDGKVVFINEDGTSKRIDGKDATAYSVVEELQKKEMADKKGVFFDISVQDANGGGGGGSKGTTQDERARF